jgi:hypothetical protein
VKSHAGIIGNEHADALAKKSATTYADIADTSIRTAGPEGNPSYSTKTLCYMLCYVSLNARSQRH